MSDEIPTSAPESHAAEDLNRRRVCPADGHFIEAIVKKENTSISSCQIIRTLLGNINKADFSW